MLSLSHIEQRLRAIGTFLAHLPTLKGYVLTSGLLSPIWPNAERAFSAETSRRMSAKVVRPSDRDHLVPNTGCSESRL